MKDRPTLTELNALSVLRRTRSFRKAADELSISSSTLSHLVRDLEARLSTRLFNRTTRSVSPTEAGDRLAERAEFILRELDGALNEIDEGRDRPKGRLRLTASETVCMLLLETVIPSFLQRFPAVQVDLVAEPAFVDIVAGGFDAGFRLGEAVPLDMVAVRFGGPSRMVAVASPVYLRDRKLPEAPDDLSKHDCIASRTPAGRPYKWEFERYGEALEIDVTGALTLNRTELMIEAALRGLGIALVPERLASTHIAEGSLRSLLDDWSPSYPGLFLYYPGHRLPPPSLRAFIGVLRELSPEF